MLRRNVRLRAEYIETKRLEDEINELNANKQVVKQCHDEGKSVPTHLLELEKEMRETLAFQDAESLKPTEPTFDSEYALAGVRSPSIMITTSRDAGRPTQEFVKELALMFPNANRVNRGQYALKDMVRMAQINEITDIIIVGGPSKNGYPTSLTISHLPYGPTALFEIKDVMMRHQLPEELQGHMPTHNPHLLFHRFDGKIGTRFMHILKYLFPPHMDADKTSRGVDKTRVLSFVNKKDIIHFRHHTFVNTKPKEHHTVDARKAKHIELTEVGPRFSLKPCRILRGTLDQGKDAQDEWASKEFINRRKAILSNLNLDDK